MMTPMQVTHTVRYDAPVEDVHAMLVDPSFRERATRAQGATQVEVRVQATSVTIDFRRPNDDVPGFARKLAGGDELHAVQTERWADDEYSATIEIGTQGVPARITGTRRLVADGDGTLDEFEGEAKARVPVIGGRVEKLMAEKLVEGWDNEHATGVAWLEEAR